MPDTQPYLYFVSGVLKGKEIRRISGQVRHLRKSKKYYEAIKLLLNQSS